MCQRASCSAALRPKDRSRGAVPLRARPPERDLNRCDGYARLAPDWWAIEITGWRHPAGSNTGRCARLVPAGDIRVARGGRCRESGDVVLVELEPHTVARVDVGAVDVGRLAGSGARQRGVEPCFVAAAAPPEPPFGMDVGGAWSTCWSNGFPYESNINEGLNVFRFRGARWPVSSGSVTSTRRHRSSRSRRRPPGQATGQGVP